MFTTQIRIRRALVGAALVLLPLGSVAAASGNDGDQGQQDVLITEQEQQRYERRMSQALDEWENRVETATEAGSEKAEALSEAGRRELSDVWSDVRQDWHKLEDASGEAWQESREAFEDSMRTLEKRWEELES